MKIINPTEQELRFLEELRNHRAKHRKKILSEPRDEIVADIPQATLGQKISDQVAKTVGSWRFIFIQSVCICAWITFNSVHKTNQWDPYPFILLNLLLSFQAAYTAPVIMMSQNRLSEIDRQQAKSDYDVNVKAELEIEFLHQKIDLMREKELMVLAQALEALTEKLSRAESQNVKTSNLEKEG